MPYQIIRHSDELIWVTFEGQVALEHAESYFHEMWQALDSCSKRTDVLVDGRFIGGGHQNAHKRAEQIIHHPNLAHIAFVVGEQHLLLFAPLVKLVSGIGLFGNTHEAIDFLRTSRGKPPLSEMNLPVSPLNGKSKADRKAEKPAAREVGRSKPVSSRPAPNTPKPDRNRAKPASNTPPAPPKQALKFLNSLTDVVDGLNKNLGSNGRNRK
jgi:hypothetical protein